MESHTLAATLDGNRMASKQQIKIAPVPAHHMLLGIAAPIRTCQLQLCLGTKTKQHPQQRQQTSAIGRCEPGQVVTVVLKVHELVVHFVSKQLLETCVQGHGRVCAAGCRRQTPVPCCRLRETLHFPILSVLARLFRSAPDGIDATSWYIFR